MGRAGMCAAMTANPLIVDVLIAFNLGLLSQLHCLGMCGGVIGALAFALDPKAVTGRGLWPFALAYNGGRIASYVIAGAVLGLAGERLLGVLPGPHGYTLLRLFAAVVLLKGRRTLVAHPDGRVRATTTGVPWLATAGAGDVLAGLVGALLAGGSEPFDAASAGAWLHGAAAALAADRGPLVAGDVARAIPRAVRDLW